MDAVRWLARGEGTLPAPDASWLSPGELERLARMRYTKRRVEYLVARWAAKQALASAEGWPAGNPSPAEVEVGHASDGAPVPHVRGEPITRRISLTDRAGWAVCAVSPDHAEVGCDLELVEPRTRGFVADWFTPAEQAIALAAGSPDEWQQVTNLIWSAKESALKVLRTGLRRDTRSVEVTLGEAGGGAWTSFEVRSAEGQVFPGWWRRFGTFVLTVAATRPLGAPVDLEDPPALASATPVHSWVEQPRWSP